MLVSQPRSLGEFQAPIRDHVSKTKRGHEEKSSRLSSDLHTCEHPPIDSMHIYKINKSLLAYIAYLFFPDMFVTSQTLSFISVYLNFFLILCLCTSFNIQCAVLEISCMWQFLTLYLQQRHKIRPLLQLPTECLYLHCHWQFKLYQCQTKSAIPFLASNIFTRCWRHHP